MSKILIVSDTHGNFDLLQKITVQFSDCTFFLHLGDSELPPYLIHPFISVKGNCDYEDYPMFRELSFPFGNIYCEHGHNKSRTLDYIKSKNCVIYLHGHTHCHYLKKEGDIYIANPGSLTKPRDGTSGTFLIIKEDKSELSFEFHSIDELLF